MDIELGDKVKDTITGFTGTAVCRMSWLTGCDRIIVQPDVDKKDGKMPESQTFDEPMLKVLKKVKVDLPERDTGGPRPARASLHKATPPRY
jgi:hypothetical protein